MTLGFIVGRILRELIELAERAADAELVDALHGDGHRRWLTASGAAAVGAVRGRWSTRRRLQDDSAGRCRGPAPH